MDVHTIVISLIIFVILAFLIWFITSLTVRERPFEERIEQQRLIERELLQLEGRQGANSPGSKKDKTKKKQNKKIKAAGEQDTSGSISTEKLESGKKSKSSKVLELEIEPEIIETSLDEPPAALSKKKTKATASPVTAAKPILTNKDEKSGIRKTDETPELHHYVVPKDAVELKHEREKVKSAANQSTSKSDSELKKPVDHAKLSKPVPEVVKEIADAAPVVVTANSDVSKVSMIVNGTSEKGKPKKQKQREVENLQHVVHDEIKAVFEQVSTAAPLTSTVAPVISTVDQHSKKKNKSNDSAPSSETVQLITVDTLIESLQKITVNDEEAKRLTDVLITRKLLRAEAVPQGVEWTKKGQKDPSNVLAKQLEDKKKEIEEEKLHATFAAGKINELQQEVYDLRQKLANLVKQNNDQLTSQHQENAALAAHNKQLEATAVNLRSQLDSMKAQLSASHNDLQRVSTENMHLIAKSQQLTSNESMLEEMRQKVKIMDDALKTNAVSFNACENVKKGLESKVKHLEDQVSILEASLRDSQILVQRYSEAPEELRKAEILRNKLAMEMEHLTSRVQHLEKELASKQDEVKMSENRLHDMTRQKSEIEGRLRMADTQATELVDSLKVRDTEVQALRAQLNEVLTELKVFKEKHVSSEVSSREKTVVISEAQVTSSAAPLEDLLENGNTECNLVEQQKLVEELKRREAQFEDLAAEIETLKHDKKVLDEGKKEVDKLNVVLNQKQQELEQELGKSKASLDQLQKNFADIQLNLQQKEKDLNELEKRFQQKEIELRDASSHQPQNSPSLEQKDSRLVELEAQLHEKEAECTSLEQRLHEAGNNGVALQQKEANVAELEDRLRQKEAELSGAADQLQQKGSEITSLQDETSKLKAEVDELKFRLSKSEESLSLIESALQQKESELAAVKEKNSTTVDSTVVQLSSLTEERNDLQARLLKAEEKLASLQKAFDAVSAEENSGHAQAVSDLKSQLSHLQHENLRLTESLEHIKKEHVTERSLWTTYLQRLFPDKQISDANLPELLSSFEQAVQCSQETSSSDADLSKLQLDLSRSKEAENVLLMQIQHYKNVLSDTESILRKLQDTVETEEQKSLQKLHSLETQLQVARDDLRNLREEMKGMHKITECFIGNTTPAVDHAECMLRKDLSVGKKRRSLDELSEENSAS